MRKNKPSEQQRARRAKEFDEACAFVEWLFAPTKFDRAPNLYEFGRALRRHVYFDEELRTQASRAWAMAGKREPEPRESDYTEACRTVREAAERLSVPSVPPVPESPVGLGRYRLYCRRIWETALEASGAYTSTPKPLEGDGTAGSSPPPESQEPRRAGPDFKPASYFQRFDPNLPDRLRHAARAGRKTKVVRSRTERGVKLYSEEDARQWWPQSFDGFTTKQPPRT